MLHTRTVRCTSPLRSWFYGSKVLVPSHSFLLKASCCEGQMCSDLQPWWRYQWSRHCLGIWEVNRKIGCNGVQRNLTMFASTKVYFLFALVLACTNGFHFNGRTNFNIKSSLQMNDVRKTENKRDKSLAGILGDAIINDRTELMHFWCPTRQ